MNRLREVAWIGVGLALLPLARARGAATAGAPVGAVPRAPWLRRPLVSGAAGSDSPEVGTPAQRLRDTTQDGGYRS